ncbi:MAG: right-handed parallel beta-helix repeat-containing protein [Candidatus Heimdallarchaeota archaeon]|nr:right-handed parallel beta-helix repeat-containing protein [Candidatus Heimdallarchaeota archaeon]
MTNSFSSANTSIKHLYTTDLLELVNSGVLTFVGDDQLSSAGFIGQGTADDPYIIEDLVLSNDSTLLMLKSISKYVVIQNCSFDGQIMNAMTNSSFNFGFNFEDIENIYKYKVGLLLDNVTNLIVRNNTFTNLEGGLFSYKSNLNINENQFNNSGGYGILNYQSTGNITMNTVSMANTGILFYQSSSYEISENCVFNLTRNSNTYGLFISSSEIYKISNNEIYNLISQDSDSYGMRIFDSEISEVEENLINLIRSNNIASGIGLLNFDVNFMIRNVIFDVHGDYYSFGIANLGGIGYIESIRGNEVYRITGNSSIGINTDWILHPDRTLGVPKVNTLFNNTIKDIIGVNISIGILFATWTSNIISNSISNCELGLYLNLSAHEPAPIMRSKISNNSIKSNEIGLLLDLYSNGIINGYIHLHSNTFSNNTVGIKMNHDINAKIEELEVIWNNFFDSSFHIIDNIYYESMRVIYYNYYDDLIKIDRDNDKINDNSCLIDSEIDNDREDIYPVIYPNPMNCTFFPEPLIITPNDGLIIDIDPPSITSYNITWSQPKPYSGLNLSYSIIVRVEDNWEVLADNIISKSYLWNISASSEGNVKLKIISTVINGSYFQESDIVDIFLNILRTSNTLPNNELKDYLPIIISVTFVITGLAYLVMKYRKKANRDKSKEIKKYIEKVKKELEK